VNFILNPDVAFVVLGVALLVTIFALLAPGSGILEVLALALLIFVGYAVANLPVNAWALALILIGIVSVIVTFRRTRQWYFIVGSIVVLIIGMAFVFRSETSFFGVNPLLAAVVSVSLGAFIWLVGHNISLTFHQKPYSDLDRMMGMLGTTTTDVHKEGSVYVDGEHWSAISDSPIAKGSQVKVLERNGLVLKVEAISNDK
jgi:membrane-bound serine protease (ClpP class)